MLKPTDSAIKTYYANLDAAKSQNALHEGNVRNAFGGLLEEAAKARSWILVTEHSAQAGKRGIRYDGVLRDQYRLPHGYWEAKDSSDDLTAEIRKKIERGYSLNNTIFEDTRQAVLYQDGRESMTADMRDADKLTHLLNAFLNYNMPPFVKFEQAVQHFAGEIPHIARTLQEQIEQAHRENERFQKAFARFYKLCKTALNPNLRREAVDEMLIQHMLTERLIVRVFDREKFTRQNVIANEIENVIEALTSKQFEYSKFLGALDRFYDAIEGAADTLASYAEKQAFLKKDYHSTVFAMSDIPACRSSESPAGTSSHRSTLPTIFRCCSDRHSAAGSRPTDRLENAA
jgi:hypothetical protein